MVQEKSLASIHVLAGRTTALNSFQYMNTNANNNSSLRYKGLRSHMKVAHVELFRGGSRLVPRYAVTATNRN